jgi:thioredoxin-dependent peroxiredoxin
MASLEIGANAPPFILPNQDGNNISLSELRGGRVLLWFYSRAFGSN